jgi:hypothetical protein
MGQLGWPVIARMRIDRIVLANPSLRAILTKGSG